MTTNVVIGIVRVKERWEASFETHECIKVQSRHFEQL